MDPQTDITRVLQAAREGDSEAAAELLPLVYDQLRSLAASRMRGIPPGQTLQPTALVHEAYARLVGAEDPDWENRAHFFFAAARAMRDILVEDARRKASAKRGGDCRRVDLAQLSVALDAAPGAMLALDEALRALAHEDDRKHRVVLLRFFAGLTEEQIAGMLDVSTRTVKRDWRFATARLHKLLTEQAGSDGQ